MYKKLTNKEDLSKLIGKEVKVNRLLDEDYTKGFVSKVYIDDFTLMVKQTSISDTSFPVYFNDLDEMIESIEVKS